MTIMIMGIFILVIAALAIEKVVDVVREHRYNVKLNELKKYEEKLESLDTCIKMQYGETGSKVLFIMKRNSNFVFDPISWANVKFSELAAVNYAVKTLDKDSDIITEARKIVNKALHRKDENQIMSLETHDEIYSVIQFFKDFEIYKLSEQEREIFLEGYEKYSKVKFK